MLLTGLLSLAGAMISASEAYAKDAPERLVSLDMCMDWLVAYHASPDIVAAFSPLWRNHPLPGEKRNWPVHDGSLEQVYRIQPDLVLVGQYNALMLRERLMSLGIRVEKINLPVDLAGVEGYERKILGLLGLPQGLAAPAPPAEPLSDNAPRLLLLGANGIGTGRGTFENQLIERAGWQNYLDANGYINVDLEKIVRHPPDAIAWSAPASPALANRLKDHPVLHQAVPSENWLEIEYWRWQCPGPWMWQLVEQLKQWHD